MSADAKKSEDAPAELDSKEKMAGKWPVRWTKAPDGKELPKPTSSDE